MKTTPRIIVTFVLAAALCAARADACSTFCFDTPLGQVFGKNYDWNVDVGMIVVNKRGVSKVAMTDDNPAKWTSRFGSVTFNQYGRELPSGGINEAGLVIELMWLDDTRYPVPDSRPTVTTLQWIQYQLDTAASVGDVIASDAKVRITSRGTPIHFLVADKGDACASIEFIGGKMVAHTGDHMPYRALTNSPYEQSREFADRVAGDGEAPRGSGSLQRFARAAQTAAAYDATTDPVDYAFALLGGVAQGDYTQWRIVYDLAAMRVYVATRRNPQRRWLDLEGLDFDCASAVVVADVNDTPAGDLRKRLQPYKQETNLGLITAAFHQTDFLRDTPREQLEALSRYPEGTRCGE